MVGHGSVVMLIGLLAGFGLGASIIGGFEIFPGEIIGFDLPSDSSAWARAHVGGLTNGLMVLVGAALLYALRAPEKLSRRLFWMLVGAGYANSIFYWAALFAPNRAVSFGDNPEGETNVAAVIGFLPAFIFAAVTMVAFSMLASYAFKSARSELPERGAPASEREGGASRASEPAGADGGNEVGRSEGSLR